MLLASVLLALGCASKPGGTARYAEALQGPAQPHDVAALMREPSPHCMTQATHVLGGTGNLYRTSVPEELHARTATLLRGLPSTAKQVLRRLDSVWFARTLPGAEARFVPCDGRDGGQGLVLLDANTSLAEDVRDTDVPRLYWGLLGGSSEPGGATSTVGHGAAHHGVRYVLLHELGHALSLLSGEFTLGPAGQFDVNAWDGFVSFSWRARQPNAIGQQLHETGGLVPARLAFADWRRLRLALDSGPSWLAPGYRSVSTRPIGGLCSLVNELPRAGFVTPTAATAPTEDYAELFAHAILANEGLLRASDAIVVTVEGCPATWLHPPYFRPGVSTKRAYLEQRLGLSEPQPHAAASSWR